MATPERAFSGLFSEEDRAFPGLIGEEDRAFSGLFADEQQEEQRGFLGTLVEETAEDVAGGFKTAAATGGEALRLLGLSVPLGFEDLTQRDKTGALMLAALGAGGVAGGAVRGASFLSKLGTGVAGRAGSAATAEAAAGAAFGLIRPLEEDEGRAGAVLSDAALFGSLGAGFSLTSSAVKATLSGTLGGMRDQLKRGNLAKLAQFEDAAPLAQEVGGMTLLNPKTEAEAILRRESPDAVSFIVRHPEGGTTTRTFDDFGQAGAKALQEGFSENLGPARRTLTDEATDFIDEPVLRAIEEEDGRIFEALEEINLGEYAAVREAARLGKISKRDFDAVAAEIVTPSGGLSGPDALQPVKLQQKERNDLVRNIARPNDELRELSDADLLREGVKQGLVSSETLEHGTRMRRLMRELRLNDLVPKKFMDTRIVDRNRDSFMTKVFTPRFIAKLHPEVRPLVKSANARQFAQQERLGARMQQLVDLKDAVSPGAAKKAVQIIDDSARAGGVQEARQLALQDARATGNPEIVRFVEESTEMFAGYLDELRQLGKLENGRAGYFPILHTGNWRVELVDQAGGKSVGEFAGLHNSKKEALEEVAKLRSVNPDAQFSITRASNWHSEQAIARQKSGEFRRLEKALNEAAEEGAITTTEADDLLQRFGDGSGFRAPSGAQTGFTRERTLGLRDYAEDPFRSLEAYVNSVERVISLEASPQSALAKLAGETDQLARASFAAEAQQLKQVIPDTKSNLRHWVQQLSDDMLGKPRQSEKTIQALAEWAGEKLDADVAPRALQRWTATIRHWQGFAKLGGLASGAVNLTQISTNTVAKLGVKDTVRGMAVLRSPKSVDKALKTLKENGLDMGMFIPLTKEGEVTSYGTLSAGKLEKFKDTVFNAFLFMFNGAEKVNRLVTAWGAFQREISNGASRKTAARIAEETVKDTQFVYRMSNMPEILRGPVGATLGQFKSFIINEAEFIASLNRKEMARFGAGLWATGGAAAFMNQPIGGLVDQASTFFMDEKISELMQTRAGDPDASRFEQFLGFGIPGGLMEINVSDRVGIGTMAEVTDGVFGPSVDDARSIVRFVKDAAIEFSATGSITNGTKQTLASAVVPTAIRRAQRAERIARTGEVEDPYTQKLVYRPSDRYQEALREFVGFPSLEAERERASEAIVARVRERFIRNRTQFSKRAARAANEGDTEKVQAAVAEAAKNGYPINNRTIRYWQKQLTRPAAERRRRRTPQARRQELEELFEATGSVDTSLLPAGSL